MCVIKVLLLLISVCQALDINVVPYGVVTVNEGNGRIQTGSYEVVVITQRPSSLRQQYLAPLLAKAKDILTMADKDQVVNIDAYMTRLQRLQAPGCVKRGLINAVGELTKSLFGIATQKDVTKIKQTVNELVAESNTGKVVVRDVIVCVNQIMRQQRKIQEKVNVLAKHVNQLQDDIGTLTGVYDQVGVPVHYRNAGCNRKCIITCRRNS